MGRLLKIYDQISFHLYIAAVEELTLKVEFPPLIIILKNSLFNNSMYSRRNILKKAYNMVSTLSAFLSI